VKENLLRLIGNTPSPYTQKMLALLRYRRIPYAVTWGQPEEVCRHLGIEPPKPVLLPTFVMGEAGDEKAICDSTPIIRRLEDEYTGRSVLPFDPALAFIDYLIEDFADEWCTKYMFHYRWHPEVDADNAGTLLPLGFDSTMSDEALSQAKAFFSERQISRLYVVGSNETTAPIIDASYRRFLKAMEHHLQSQYYMLGNRPGAGDFGLFGQLTQLVGFDPTPRQIAHDISPRTVAWVDKVADLSGLEPTPEDWLPLEEQPASLLELLAEIGRVYAPAQLANAAAAAAGEKNWQCDIDGAAWAQPTFGYQAKCLRFTREAYRLLSISDRDRVDQFLTGTGIESMLVEDNYS